MGRPTQMMREALAAQGAGQENLIKAYYTYSMTFPAVASGGTSTATIQIQADSDFMIQSASIFAFDTVANTVVASPIATIQITDTGSGTTLYAQPVYVGNVFGTGQLPFLFPVPRLVNANAVLSGVLVNGVTANAVTFMASFHGRKLFKG